MTRWSAGRVFVEDAIWSPHGARGEDLRRRYLPEMQSLTFGLVQARANSLWLGALELIRLGDPRVTESNVEWPISGGWATGAPGGTLNVRAEPGRWRVEIAGYRPKLPRFVYSMTQLPFHHLTARLFLLHMRGRKPAPGPAAAPADRRRAAAIDLALCAGLTLVIGRRHRMRRFAGIVAGYHVACWSLSGRTLGGQITKLRVVAVDGSRLTPTQSLVRLLVLPVSLWRGRNEHDRIAGTDVVAD